MGANIFHALLNIDKYRVTNLSEYNTTYDLPAGVTSSEAEGDVAGELDIKAGTQILIIYASVTTVEGVYKLSATKTSSDDLNDTGDPNPIGP